MNKNNLLKYVLPILAVSAFSPALAGNVNVADARRAASEFIHLQSKVRGTFLAARGTSAADLTLAHAEASQAVAGANDYYAFNVPTGGWVIVSGDDRATTVLGYNDRGHLDFDRLPCTMRSLLDSYKREIEFLQKQPAPAKAAAPRMRLSAPAGIRTITVGPLISSTWGQEAPYDWQCPVYRGEYCVVGCVATAMAQVMNFWEYPQTSGAIQSFYCSSISSTVAALPETTFDYSLILDSYCHWDWTTSTLVQDEYTDAQAQEVAKLSRYCGQAVEMGYSPEGSGAYTWDQLDAMKRFGFRSSAKLVQRSGWWDDNYSDSEWETMIKTEINAGRPILYSASDTNGGGGHAFICDGYNSDGLFHFNMGWYGTCDGWYASTALNMTHRDGDVLHFNSGHDMIIGIEPPEGWVRPSSLKTGDINGDGEVDVMDVNIIVNIMLGKDEASKYPGNANVDGQEGIDVSDVNAVVNIMLGKVNS